MSTNDVIKIVAGVLAGGAALLSFGFGIYQYAARRKQESLAEIIQGEKETAAAAAVRIRSMKRSPRQQELQALCLASVFERSGRTRSLIHAALKAQQVNNPDEIRDIVDQITVVIGRNASYTDLTRARRRLISLRSALSLDGDTRTRIDAIEICTGAARKDGETPCGCEHEAHSWAQVRQPLLLLGKLVLVPDTGEGQSESIRSGTRSAYHHSRLSPNSGGQPFLIRPDAGRRKVRQRSQTGRCRTRATCQQPATFHSYRRIIFIGRCHSGDTRNGTPVQR